MTAVTLGRENHAVHTSRARRKRQQNSLRERRWQYSYHCRSGFVFCKITHGLRTLDIDNRNALEAEKITHRYKLRQRRIAGHQTDLFLLAGQGVSRLLCFSDNGLQLGKSLHVSARQTT